MFSALRFALLADRHVINVQQNDANTRSVCRSLTIKQGLHLKILHLCTKPHIIQCLTAMYDCTQRQPITQNLIYSKQIQYATVQFVQHSPMLHTIVVQAHDCAQNGTVVKITHMWCRASQSLSGGRLSWRLLTGPQSSSRDQTQSNQLPAWDLSC